VNRIVLISQAPGRANGDPLAGASGRRLASLAGLDLDEFLNRFDRVSLLDHPTGKASTFDARAALDRADALREELDGRKAVLLGRLVARSFRLKDEDYEWFKPVQLPPNLEVAVMPHPSGVSTWWNSPDSVRAAEAFMKRVRLGFLSIKKPEKKTLGRPEKFDPEQVAFALEATDGIPIDAAALLAEETGLSCTRVNVMQYCNRYPELAELRVEARQKLGDIAERNIARAIREGDADISYKVLRSVMFAERGYTMAGRFEFQGNVDHRHLHAHGLIDAQLAAAGLDLSAMSAEQLLTIKEFVEALSGSPARHTQPSLPGPAEL
jgi:uracil-DNA glycosylase